MKTLLSFFKCSYSIVAVAVFCFGLTSCEVMQGMLEGMASYPAYGYGMTTGYNSDYANYAVSSTGTSGSHSSASSSSSSYTSSSGGSLCHTCAGSGHCSSRSYTAAKYRCYGSGKCAHCSNGIAYGSGTQTVCSVCKGTNRCSYCNGTGKCFSCGGTGSKAI